MTLSRLAAAHAVATSYVDQGGVTVQVGERAVVAALHALGVDASTPEAVEAALVEHEAAPWRRLLPHGVVARQGTRAWCELRAPEGAALRV